MKPDIISTDFGSYHISSWVEEAITVGRSLNPVDYTDYPTFDQEYHRSAFQKCIRRGITDLALYHGAKMQFLDDKAAWFTLSVIAGEDVGIGNPGMVALSLLTTLKGFRTIIGQDDYLFAGIITILCKSPKNRLGCQLNVLADSGEIPSAAALGNLSDDDLIAYLKKTDPYEWVLQFIALRELRQRCRHGNIELLAKVIRVIRQSFPNPMIGLAAALCFERATDTLHHGTALVMAHVFGAGPCVTLLKPGPHAGYWDDPPTVDANGFIPYPVLDQHTSIGRMALVRWAKTDKMQALANKYGVLPAKMNKLLGAAHFFNEAALVYPPLIIQNSDLNAITLEQERAYTSSRIESPLSATQYIEAEKAIKEDMPSFLDICKYLWTKEKG
jgi:hypothetical protein